MGSEVIKLWLSSFPVVSTGREVGGDECCYSYNYAAVEVCENTMNDIGDIEGGHTAKVGLV